MELNIQKHNAQYKSIEIQRFRKAHDRFLIIDEDVYLIGASIIRGVSAIEITNRLNAR